MLLKLLLSEATFRVLLFIYVKNGQFEVVGQESGTARCPFGPNHNSTTHYSGQWVTAIARLFENVTMSAGSMLNEESVGQNVQEY